jgi:flagellar motor switch protein FliN/FliY
VSTRDSTQHDALVRLGASTAEAIALVLENWAPGTIERGDVTVLPESANPFSSLTRGAVAASVSYVDGVTGANIFALTPAGARKLASSMGVPAPEPSEDGETPDEMSELEMSAIAEVSNQMMAAAAGAIGVVLGQQIEISVPETRVIEDPADAPEYYGSSPHATSVTFMIDGESCRLIQLVPSAFVVRMVRALDELGGETTGGEAESREPGADGEPTSTGLVDALGDIRLRVWAELGRAKIPLGRALGLPLGSLVELDRETDAPVDLFVNGIRFAQGHLFVTDDGEWAFRCDEVGGRTVAGPAPLIPTPEPEQQGAVS